MSEGAEYSIREGHQGNQQADFYQSDLSSVFFLSLMKFVYHNGN